MADKKAKIDFEASGLPSLGRAVEEQITQSGIAAVAELHGKIAGLVSSGMGGSPMGANTGRTAATIAGASGKQSSGNGALNNPGPGSPRTPMAGSIGAVAPVLRNAMGQFTSNPAYKLASRNPTFDTSPGPGISSHSRISDIRTLQAEQVEGIDDFSSDRTIQGAKLDLRVQRIKDRKSRQLSLSTKRNNALNPTDPDDITMSASPDEMMMWGKSSPWSPIAKTIMGGQQTMMAASWQVGGNNTLSPGWGSGGQGYGQLPQRPPFQLMGTPGGWGGTPIPGGPPLYSSPAGPPNPNTPGPWQFNASPSVAGIQQGMQQYGMTTSGWGNRFLRGGLAVAGRYAGEVADNETQFNLTGRRNVGAEAGATGSLVGGIIGAGIGSLFAGPFGTFVGAGVGAQAGNQIAQYVVSKNIADIGRQELLQPAAALSGNLNNQMGSFSYNNRGSGFDNGFNVGLNPKGEREWLNPALKPMSDMSANADLMATHIGTHYWKLPTEGDRDKSWTDRYMTPDQMAQTYSTAYSSLVEAGINPEQMVRNGMAGRVAGHKGDAAIQDGEDYFNSNGTKRKGFQLLNAQTNAAKIAIGEEMNLKDSKSVEDEQLYAHLTHIAAIRWGTAGKDIFSKQVAPILSTINQTGGNTADILMKYGVGATNSFIEDTTEITDKPRVSLQQLMDVHRTEEKIGRSLEFSATRPRDQGARAADLIGFEQTNIASIPGGKDSLIYAQLGEQKRQAGFRANRESDIMSYDLPMAALEGQEQRRQYLPNMPGYGMKLSLERMGMRAGYLGMRQNRYAAQVAGGQLSEEEQLQQFQQIEGLKNDQARDLGMLAEGGQDRMLAFSGGRPSFFARMDSVSLARTAMVRSGSPQIGFGAQNGQHLQYQNDFFRQFSTNGFDALHAMAPHSLTGQQNGPQVPTGKSVDILQRILDVLQKIQNGDGGVTPTKGNPNGGVSTNSGYGNAHANQQVSSLNPSSSYGRGQS